MRILVLGAEECFRTGVVANLCDDGHPVLEYHSTATLPPLATLDAIDAVLIDDHQDDEWLTFARAFHQRFPNVPIVVSLARWSPPIERTIRDIGSVIRKPTGYGELHALLHR